MATRPKKIPGWKLVWHDEFDGHEIDRTKWDFDIGNGFFDYASHTWVAGWGNEELQYYTDASANASVKDSLLTIRAQKEALHGCGYTSARLKTRRDGTPLFMQRYGRFEIRAKVPWGKGLWPALWMLPQSDTYGGWAASGEIDLMEIVGEKPHEVLNSIHFGSPGPEARSLITHVHPLPGGSTVADWHVYACEWEPGEIRFYVDDVHTCTRDHWWSSSVVDAKGKGVIARRAADLNPWPAPFDQPFYLLMNVAVGGNFPGVPNAETHFPAELVVDYVRVYEKLGGYGPARPIGKGKFPWQTRKR